MVLLVPGKTELQKYLVGFMKENTRIILLEDEYETFLKELYPNLDIVTWITFNNQENISKEMRKLIKQALRNNPEWLIISEVRGEEAKELYSSLTTGHPLITTIHSKSAYKSIERLAYLMDISLDNLKKTKIYRTDQNGSIIIKINKKVANFATHKKFI